MTRITEAAASSRSTHSSRIHRDGNVIKTPRYDITIEKDRVRVHDRQTNTWFEAHGDPHIGTGDDGNSVTDFTHSNLTVDLADGTKITIIPTQANANGVSYIDKVAIMNGRDATVVENIHGSGAIAFGKNTRNAHDVDEQFEDGTVLYVGAEADDLFLDDGEELVDGLYDNIDGKGGTSQVVVRNDDQGVVDRLFDELRGVKSELDNAIEGLRYIDKDKDPVGFQKELAHIQQLQQQIEQILTLLTNISKSYHDTAMAIINNIRN